MCRSGLILDSFLDGKDSVACSSGSEPIGFLAAPSCFALTSFQVGCRVFDLTNSDHS